ncbi:MAG: penicillin-binding protein activator, partial [Pseudomonadota bacterium]
MFRLSFKPVFLKPVLLGLAALSLLVAGCAPGARGPSGSASAPRVQGPTFQPGEVVTMALLSPQSSPNQGAAALGQALVNAARMGMVDLGERQLALKVYDTAGDPARAAQQAQAAIAEGADIILGPLFSAATKSVAQVAAPRGIKVLSFSTDSSAASNGVWLTGFLPEMEAQRILSYARAQGRGQVGVFYPATAYGEAALRGAQQAQRQGQTQIVGSGAFQPGFNGVQ